MDVLTCHRSHYTFQLPAAIFNVGLKIMLQVNDTTSNWSIWKGVNQEVFEKNIDTLHNIKRVVKPIETPANKIPSSSSSHKIPFQIEAQLVNDFAFLAAYDYGVKYVAAACLEESDTKGFTLRLAANEGVHGRVQSCISEILSYFSRCATKCRRIIRYHGIN